MPTEILEFSKSIVSALIGSGLTLAVVAKFGQSWFFKKIDAKYAMDLAEKNNQMMGDLERKKNDLNKELQIEVTHFKAQLEVLGSQQSKFLEKKINSVLLLNQSHYLAVKKIKEFTDVTNIWVDEAASYFLYQINDKDRTNLASYDVYREMKEDKWPAYQKAAESAFSKYAECLALNMPILPRALVEEDMVILEKFRNILADGSLIFGRAMNFTRYIVEPEESEGTEEEFMAALVEERDKSTAHKGYMDQLSNQLFEKSLRSGALIESLLQHQKSN